MIGRERELALMESQEKTGLHLLRQAYPRRPDWSYKGQFGKVLVVGGSSDYTGSPIFNCLGAYASGADLVTLLAPKRAADTAASYAPEIIAPPLCCDFIDESCVDAILSNSKKHDALVIGGGLSRKPKTKMAVLKILESITIPTVVDADALRFISGRFLALPKTGKFILTPHADELRELALEKNVPKADLGARISLSKKVATKYGVVILLKGHVDVITDGKRVILDYECSPFLTKGGIGDVTAGVCGALLARKIPPFEAAATAAYIVGLAGAKAAKKFGEGTLPSHVIAAIPLVLQKK